MWGERGAVVVVVVVLVRPPARHSLRQARAMRVTAARRRRQIGSEWRADAYLISLVLAGPARRDWGPALRGALHSAWS